jgi:hypothetical protein
VPSISTDRATVPGPICATNSFWLRGYGDGTAPSAIVLGHREDEVHQSCASVTRVGHVTNRYGIANEETGHPHIYLCRGLTLTWPQIWANSRSFG